MIKILLHIYLLLFIIVIFIMKLTRISPFTFLGGNLFIFDSGLKTGTTSLDTHYVLTLGWDSIHSTFNSLNSFVILLYLEIHIIDFRVNFTIRDISDLIFCLLFTNLYDSILPKLVFY